MRDVLTFNGRALSEFNVFFDLSETFINPEKDYEIISIPGRNGDLSIYNNKFKDITISIPCFFRSNFLENYRNLMQFLNGVTGFQRLESSKEPNLYRKALFVGSVTPTTGSFLKSGKFTLTFKCHPQRWLKSSEEYIVVDDAYEFYNPTNMPSKPMIRITGNGRINITDANHQFTGRVEVANNEDRTVYIDCETYDSYSIENDETVNRNADVTFLVDPVIVPGDVYITWYRINQGSFAIMPRFFFI